MTERNVLVLFGPDPDLKLDLSAFETITRQTGVQFRRFDRPSLEGLTAHIRRSRIQDHAMPDVHIAAHMSPDSIQLDRTITPGELSTALAGTPEIYTKHLFLAGCESAEIGDKLGVVPFVLTMLNTIDHESARIFTLLWWGMIAHGDDAQTAYDRSVSLVPDVAPHTYLHRHDGADNTHFLAPTA